MQISMTLDDLDKFDNRSQVAAVDAALRLLELVNSKTNFLVFHAKYKTTKEDGWSLIELPHISELVLIDGRLSANLYLPEGVELRPLTTAEVLALLAIEYKKRVN